MEVIYTDFRSHGNIHYYKRMAETMEAVTNKTSDGGM